MLLAFSGTPQTPTINDAISSSPGVAALDVSTKEAGVEDSEDSLEFIVNATMVTVNGTSVLTSHKIVNYVDSMVITIIITNLLPDLEYQFSVMAKNEFGTSEFSEANTLHIMSESFLATGMTIIYCISSRINFTFYMYTH